MFDLEPAATDYDSDHFLAPTLKQLSVGSPSKRSIECNVLRSRAYPITQ